MVNITNQSTDIFTQFFLGGGRIQFSQIETSGINKKCKARMSHLSYQNIWDFKCLIFAGLCPRYIQTVNKFVHGTWSTCSCAFHKGFAYKEKHIMK